MPCFKFYNGTSYKYNLLNIYYFICRGKHG